jgi:DNA-binding MarR family transcriptional regulator
MSARAREGDEGSASDQAELDLSILRDDVGFQIHITQRAIWQSLRRRRLERVPREPSGYHSSLILIGANPGISNKDLAEALVIDSPNVTLILGRMEKAGLVERRQDPADRRKVLLTLTAAGENYLGEALAFNQGQRRMFETGLSEEETLHLTRLLQKLQRALKSAGADQGA